MLSSTCDIRFGFIESLFPACSENFPTTGCREKPRRACSGRDDSIARRALPSLQNGLQVSVRLEELLDNRKLNGLSGSL